MMVAVREKVETWCLSAFWNNRRATSGQPLPSSWEYFRFYGKFIRGEILRNATTVHIGTHRLSILCREVLLR